MSDLDDLKRLLTKAGADFAEDTKPLSCGRTDPRAYTSLWVMPGYRCHFEAEFDTGGNIVSIGQWEDM